MNVYFWVYTVFIFIALLIQSHNHGKPKEGNYNFWSSSVCLILEWGLITLAVVFGGAII